MLMVFYFNRMRSYLAGLMTLSVNMIIHLVHFLTAEFAEDAEIMKREGKFFPRPRIRFSGWAVILRLSRS
jgi:hypothetical protein